MDKEDIKVGMMVDYHSIINGKTTEPYCQIASEPWQLGHGQWVVQIDKKRGGISLDALTPFNVDHSGTDDIVCPYCGYEYQDGDDIRDVSKPFDLGMIECDNCNNTFTGEIERSEGSIIRDREISRMNFDYRQSRVEWRREKAAGEVYDVQH